jgi:hypothetical protein
MPFVSVAVGQKIIEIQIGFGIRKRLPAQKSGGPYETQRGPVL